MIWFYLIVVLGVLVASVSQLFLKSSSNAEHTSLLAEYLNPKVIGGYLLMVLVLCGDIFAMAHGVKAKEVSVLESLSYLFVPILSLLFLGEKIDRKKMVAICIILIGITIFYF